VTVDQPSLSELEQDHAGPRFAQRVIELVDARAVRRRRHLRLGLVAASVALATCAVVIPTLRRGRVADAITVDQRATELHRELDALRQDVIEWNAASEVVPPPEVMFRLAGYRPNQM
jgi:hypothetical protein